MGSDTPPSFSFKSQMASNYDEIFMQHSLHFADSLKDLKNLRKQLYSAAEHFESSYDKDDHQQFVIESSKDYVAKALVSTVDHLGSVADKLNKFLGEKANEFSATNIRFSCIEQRLNMFQGFIDLRGISQHSLMIEAPKHHKQYIVPAAETFHIGRSKLMYRNCIWCPQYDMHQPKQGRFGVLNLDQLKQRQDYHKLNLDSFLFFENRPEIKEHIRLCPPAKTIGSLNYRRSWRCKMLFWNITSTTSA